jgi:hypothetical protein
MQRCKLHQSWKKMVYEIKENLQIIKNTTSQDGNHWLNINYCCFDICSTRTNPEGKRKVWSNLDEGEESFHSQLRFAILLNLDLSPFCDNVFHLELRNMEFLKIQVLSNKFNPTKYLVHKILKQILEFGEDSKNTKNSIVVNQTRSQIVQNMW